MKVWNKNLSTLYVDIDDTITKDMGSSFIKNSLEQLKKHSDTVNIFLWSQGGLDYVLEIAEKSGLTGFICGCLPKPDMIVDDLSFDVFCGQIEPDWDRFSSIMGTLDGDHIDDVEELRTQKRK